jgi:phosphoglycolate phosphatase-like HAD superfamily hydrolase
MSGRRDLRGLLLDLDGTLLDTAPDMAHALNRLRAAEGLMSCLSSGSGRWCRMAHRD